MLRRDSSVAREVGGFHGRSCMRYGKSIRLPHLGVGKLEAIKGRVLQIELQLHWSTNFMDLLFRGPSEGVVNAVSSEDLALVLRVLRPDVVSVVHDLDSDVAIRIASPVDEQVLPG